MALGCDNRRDTGFAGRGVDREIVAPRDEEAPDPIDFIVVAGIDHLAGDRIGQLAVSELVFSRRRGGVDEVGHLVRRLPVRGSRRRSGV